MGDRPGVGDRPGQRPGAGNRPNARPPVAGNRPNRININNQQQWNNNRIARGNDIRRGFRDHPSHLPAYGRDFWGRHPHSHWGWHNHSGNWWRAATWGGVAGWFIGSAAQPIAYNYGDNCYYEGDNVYYDGEVVATADEYAEQAYAITQAVPEVEPDNVEWMPLGVFAMSEDGEASGPDPTIFLQLAISKEGIIAGTIQNTATDNSAEVEGTIDQKSQRAAWGRVGEDWPIMETGISNLTQDDASALIHFADGQTQQWLMVRLEEPQEDTGAP